MNILFLVLQEFSRNTESYGGKTHVFELVKSFVNLGHQAHFVTFGIPDLAKHNNLSIYNASIRKRRPIDFLQKHLLLYVLFVLKNRFLSFFKKGKDEFSYASYLIKCLIKDKKIDLIYERHTGYDPGVVIGRELGITTILELNGITPLELENRGFNDDFINENLVRELEFMKRANKIVAVSKGVKDYYISAGIDERKISVVRNGVNLNIFQPRDKYTCRKKIGLDSSNYYIGMVGTFRFYQGFEYGIRCMTYIVKEFPEAKLIIVGHSDNNFRPTKYDLLELANKLGIGKNLFLTGWKPYDEIPYYINAFDLCLVFREYDGYSCSPVKLFEYMACARPVVSSYHEDLRFIEEEGTGILVDHRNSEETGKAIAKLLKNKKTCQEMGERGFDYARRIGDWNKIADEILK